MMRRTRLLPLALALAAFPVEAQNAGELASQGIAAYRGLEYENASVLLRRAVATTGARALADSARAEAFVYLGAAELFQNRSESAGVAFGRALEAEPRYRADELVFPPAVTDVFEAVRRRTAFIRVDAPRDTTIRPARERFSVRLHASAPHAVFVELALPDGRVARQLYAGTIGDSLDVTWDGLGPDQRTPLDGSLSMRIISQTSEQRRIVRLGLEADFAGDDTLPLPREPRGAALLPEREYNSQRLGALVTGVMTGIAAAALPSFVGSGEASSTRYVVGGVIGLAGVIGFMTQREDRPIPENVTANAERREAWQRDVRAVQAENEQRRRSAGLRIRTVRQATSDPEGR
ncbi:MAG TPA: hypothetical protein VLE53_03125 [Gemmatimonadaceae bacterium]|nr:hypothetical protein [Gemmatimonadaceae bacterium]